jgi:hypothetical protein
MQRDDDDDNNDNDKDNKNGRTMFVGRGREFDLFDTRKNTIPQETVVAAERGVVKPPDAQSDDDSSLLVSPSSATAAAASSSSSAALRQSVSHSNAEEKEMTFPAAPSLSSSSSSSQDKQDSTHAMDDSDSGGITATTMVSSSDSSYSSLPTITPTSLTGGGAGSLPRFSSSAMKAEQQHATSKKRRSSLFQPVSTWWTSNISPNMQNWPKIKCRMEPTTTLKLRKTFRPLKTIVRLGADFNTQLGVWQFKSSWEDAIIGGKITLAGKELQISKSWQLSVGGGGKMMGIGTSNNNNLDDLITRLRFRAAIDLQTWKAYARVGFRTERLSPINVMEGFTLFQQVPLDGAAGHVKLEIKANFALPEPEIEYSTENKGGFIGGTGTAHMGDIEINIDEFNLLLDY